jgi:hypothetical protein
MTKGRKNPALDISDGCEAYSAAMARRGWTSAE